MAVRLQTLSQRVHLPLISIPLVRMFPQNAGGATPADGGIANYIRYIVLLEWLPSQTVPTDGNYLQGPLFGADGDFHVKLADKTFAAPFTSSTAVVDVEVYAADEFLGAPRDTPHPFNDPFTDDNLQEIRRDLLKTLGGITMPHTDVEFANVLSIGPTGAGKSSFIRSADTILQNRFSHIADVGTGTRSLTKHLHKILLKPCLASMTAAGILNLPEQFKIRLWDSKGMSATTYQNGEVGVILDGHVPDNFKFDDEMAITPRCPGYIRDPVLADKVHVMLVVVAASEVCTEHVASMLRANLKSTRSRGICTILVLTKIDEHDERLVKQPHLVKESEIAKDLVTAAAAATGIPRTDIFALKNYTEEDESPHKVEVPVLRVLKRVMHAAVDYFRRIEPL